MSLMLRHQRRQKERPAAAHSAKGLAVIGSVASGMIGQQQLATLLSNALEEDLKSLHGIKSIERKIEVKRQLLIPKYRDYVSRLMAGNKRHDILGYFLVWLFDTGEIEEALDLGLSLVEQGVGLPERFNRDLYTFMADAVLEWAEAEYEAERSPEPYFSALFEKVDASAWDLPDALRAKYYRLRGLLAEKSGDIDAAVKHLERAMELGAKVKTKLAELAKEQAKDQSKPEKDKD